MKERLRVHPFWHAPWRSRVNKMLTVMTLWFSIADAKSHVAAEMEND